MTAIRTTSRTLLALFAAMALMLVVALGAFSATGTSKAASTWHISPKAASTWHVSPLAASTWNKVTTTGSTNASTWN